jgi:hypothetical protein
LIKQFFIKKQILLLKHPLYSSDLALCKFVMFQKLKIISKSLIFNHMKTFRAM